jgi:hypothetical protein
LLFKQGIDDRMGNISGMVLESLMEEYRRFARSVLAAIHAANGVHIRQTYLGQWKLKPGIAPPPNLFLSEFPLDSRTAPDVPRAEMNVEGKIVK